MRKVIYHYHLFKNAGTSLDVALKQCFPGELWATKEFPNNQQLNLQQQQEWVTETTQAVCFSSHTAQFPVIDVKEVAIFPVIFMRHPIDRILSAYSFEKRQSVDTFGSVLARNTSLMGYIETRLQVPSDRQCKNFHTAHFSKMFYPKQGNEIARAKKAVDKLPFIGSVSHFSESLARLNEKLQAFGFDDIDLEVVKKNVSRSSQSIDDKMAEFKNQVGKEFYERVLEENRNDLMLYDYFLNAHGYLSSS